MGGVILVRYGGIDALCEAFVQCAQGAQHVGQDGVPERNRFGTTGVYVASLRVQCVRV